MTSIKDPIRQASLFTMGGLIDPRLMQDPAAKPTNATRPLASSSSWWMKWRINDYFSSGKKAANA